MKPISITAKDGEVISSLSIGLDEKTSKAVIIVCHGFGEHAGSYVELAEKLHKGGYACIIPNQRGHGLPPDGVKKWHGIIPSYQSFIDDVEALTEYIKQELPDTPVALYGHSMGGNIVAYTLLSLPKKQTEAYLCAVLESPWFGLYDPPNALSLCLIKFLNKVAPNVRIAQKLNHSELSSETERINGYANDPLYHGFLSARMIVGIFAACEYSLNNAAHLSIPTFLAYANDDTVVCNNAIKDFAKKAESAITVKEYASKHAIHNDINMEFLISDVTAYIDSQLPK